jgi:hypothetical protein
MKSALMLPFALSALLFADPDSQPACRQGCEEAYEEELVACKQQTRQPVDECQDAAEDRHQDCIDRCND